MPLPPAARAHADDRPREPAPGLGAPAVPAAAAPRRFVVQTAEQPRELAVASEVSPARYSCVAGSCQGPVLVSAARPARGASGAGPPGGGTGSRGAASAGARFPHQVPGGGAQRGALPRVGQQLRQHRLQLVRPGDAAGGPARQEQLGDLGEVLHVRPEHHRLAPRGGLDHVVPAHRRQASPQKDDGGHLEQRGQLADGVEHDDVRRARRVPREPAAAHRRDSPFGRQRGHLGAALGMPRREHQDRVGHAGPQPQPGVDHRPLLAAMRAGRHQDRSAGREAQQPQGVVAPGLRVRERRRRRVELQVAGHRDPVGRRAEIDEAPGRLVALGAAPVHVGEHPPEEPPHQAVARIRPVRDAPVDQHRPDPAPGATPQQIGPQLGVDGEEQHRAHAVEHAVDGGRQVQGEVEQPVDPLDAGPDRPARPGGGRQPQPMAGVAGAQPGHQGAGGLHLAHRHRVNPDRGPPPRIDAGRQMAPAFPQRPDVLAVAHRLVREARSHQQGVADDGRAVEEVHRCGVLRGVRRAEGGVRERLERARPSVRSPLCGLTGPAVHKLQ